MVRFSPFLIRKLKSSMERKTKKTSSKNCCRRENPNRMQSSAQLIQSPTVASLPPSQVQSTAIKQCFKISRRNLTISTNSSLLLLLGSQILQPLHHSVARADDVPPNPDRIIPRDEEGSTKTAVLCGEQTVTQRAFLDVSIDGAPVGRIVIGLYGDSVPFGAARLGDLLSGAAGISYRRKEFVKITPNYVQHGGVRSYGVDAELARNAGRNLAADRLMDEWEKQYENCPGTKNVGTSIGIVVRDPLKPPPKLKLVARGGKLEVDQEEVGIQPNGTEFVIPIKDSPELDASSLVVGRVLEGLKVVEKIGQVKTVQENTTSPYFRVAKLIGDKRAVVAERGFNRPYSKVVITNCGLIKD